MGLASWTFNENTPNAPGVGISSQPITGSPSISGVNGILSSPALDEANTLSIVATITGAANGTLDICIMTMSDENNWDDQVRYALTSAGAATQSLKLVLTRGVPMGITGIGTVNKNAANANTYTPSLSLNSYVNGDWGNKIRIVMVAGSGTTSGAPLSIRIVASNSRFRFNG